MRSTSEAVIVETKHRIYTRGGHHISNFVYVGCNRQSGRVTKLLDSEDISEYFRLVGHFAAVEYSPDCMGCDFSLAFAVFDLRTGHHVYSRSDNEVDSDYGYDFNDVALDHAGNFAAIRTRLRLSDDAKTRRVIYRPRSGGKLTLDYGMDINPTSLERINATYYWRHSGVVHSFTP